MNLSQLEILIAIVDTGSLTHAGDVVGLTQSAVSYSLSKLEAELGVTLLERGRQGVTVTRIGEEVLQHARRVVGQVELIRQKTARARGLSVGKLRFGCVPTIPARLLTGILRDFNHQYPDIDVVVFEGMRQELVSWLDSGVIDIGTVLVPDNYPVSIPLVRDEIKVVLSVTHPLAEQKEIRLEQLITEPFIGPKAEYGILSNLIDLPGSATLRLRHEVSTQSTIFSMIRENMGVSIMPDMLIDRDIEDIVTVPLVSRPFMRVSLAANVQSPATQVFLEVAQKWSKEHGYLPEHT